MARVRGNPITKGLSGTLGGMLVFRKVGSKTIVAVSPESTGKISELQKENRERFHLATVFAKAQMADPAVKAGYIAVAEARGEIQPYQLAIADYFKAPDITEIDHSGYGGAMGGKINVRAFDDFKVVSVTVEILGPTGDLVEKGTAVMQANELDWVYTSITANGLVNGYKTIIARASDYAKNVTEKRIEL